MRFEEIALSFAMGFSSVKADVFVNVVITGLVTSVLRN